MHSNGHEYACRVCGYNHNDVRWERYEEKLIPSYLICDCCGVESGLEDSWIDGIKNYRKKWLDSGAKWSYPKSKPENWDLERQLAQIPDEYK